MLIQCENCHTIFHLDETRLKPDGSKVRCSRCWQIFMAYPPAVPPQEGRGNETPVARRPTEETPDDTLVSMGVEEVTPPEVVKDDDFGADLESLLTDALAEPGPDLEKEEIATPQRKEGWEETPGPSQEKEALDRDAETPETMPSREKPVKHRLRVVVLAILLALLAGVAAVAYLKPALLDPYLALLKGPEKQKPAELGVRLLQFKSVAGSFVEAANGRQLFVIRGMVHNQYAQPRSHIRVKGSILDNRGKVIESRLSYAGNTFTTEELKALPTEEVLKTLGNRDGMARQNFNVPPDATIPFIIVFQNLPDNMSEFAVEAASSSPGT